MKGLIITTGIPGNDQESSFMNATLQEHGELEFSIETRMTNVPEHIQTEEALRMYLSWVLGDIVVANPKSIEFEVQIGPEGDGS